MSKRAQITVNAVWGPALLPQPLDVIGSIAEGDTLHLVIRWITPDKNSSINLSPDAQVYGHAAPRRNRTQDGVVELSGSVVNAAAGKVLVASEPYAMSRGAQHVQVRVVDGDEAVTFAGILKVTRSLMQKGD